MEHLFEEDDKKEFNDHRFYALLLTFKGNTTAHGIPHVTNASG